MKTNINPPPEFNEESYPTVLENSWRMHRESEWMYNTQEKQFLHISTNAIYADTRSGKRAWSEDSNASGQLVSAAVRVLTSIDESNNDTDAESEEVEIDLFQDLVVGISQKKGVKEGPCEDRVIEKFRLPLQYMNSSASCVVLSCLDGHGGSFCVDYVTQQLPVSLLSNLRNPGKRKSSDAENLTSIARKAFQVTDHNFLSTAKRSKDNSGSTIVTAIFFGPDPSDGHLRLLLGSLGDSRAILYSTESNLSGTQSSVAARTSAPVHKPGDPSEYKRIVSEGGQVVNLQGVTRVVKRISSTSTVGLSVSRAFGDLLMKEPKPVVSSVPDFALTEIDFENDQFLVLGTDGVFDFVSEKEVGELVCGNSDKSVEGAKKAAERIVDLAKSRGSLDDCTCMVVDFAWATRSMPKAPTKPPANSVIENDEDIFSAL